MPVNLTAPKPADLHPVPGVRVGIAMAGVRKANRKDLVAFVLDAGTRGGRRVHAEPLLRRAGAGLPRAPGHGGHDGQDGIRALVINTGNANAGTGADGLARARRTCEAAAGAAGPASRSQVLPFSTGVIMETLPVERIEAGLPAALGDLDADALGAGRRRHHDHRHAAQGRVDAGHDRRQDGHGHRHQQGRRHDPPEHGDDAGLPRHRRGDRRRRCCRRSPGRRPTRRSTASRSTATPPPTTASS